MGTTSSNKPAEDILMVHDPCVKDTQKLKKFDMVRKNYV